MMAGDRPERRELAARLALLATPGLAPERIIPLIETHGSALAALPHLAAACDERVAQALHTPAVRERVRRALHTLDARQIRVVSFDDPDYPPALHARLDSHRPSLLFARGDLSLLERPAIAVVGSRRASEYGLDVAARVGGAVARAGGCVVSGLALGIDAAAHEAALEEGGATIAILGCGVDVYYPRRNRHLQDRIAAHGLLLSELLPGEPPRDYQFPHRNRIISALSRAVVVVEAGLKSGAIRTAVHAIVQNVPVFGVPNAIDVEQVQGILALFEDGVPPFTGTRTLLEATGLLGIGEPLPDPRPAEPPRPPDGVAGAVWSAIGRRSAHIDAITRAAAAPAGDVLAALLQLELDGLVVQLPGGRYRRARSARVTGGAVAKAAGSAAGTGTDAAATELPA